VSGFVNWIRAQWFLNLFNGFGPPVSYNVVWVNLLTAVPSSDGTGSQGSPSDYTEWAVERLPVGGPITAQPVKWSFPIPGTSQVEISNTAALAWTQGQVSAIGTQKIVLGVGIWNALTAGDLIAWDTLDTPLPVVPSNSYRFSIGNLRVRMQGIV